MSPSSATEIPNSERPRYPRLRDAQDEDPEKAETSGRGIDSRSGCDLKDHPAAVLPAGASNVAAGVGYSEQMTCRIAGEDSRKRTVLSFAERMKHGLLPSAVSLRHQLEDHPATQGCQSPGRHTCRLPRPPRTNCPPRQEPVPEVGSPSPTLCSSKARRVRYAPAS